MVQTGPRHDRQTEVVLKPARHESFFREASDVEYVDEFRGALAAEWTTPGGVRMRILSADEWLARTGQGNHATLSIAPSRMPAPPPALEPRDADPTTTQPELADNG